MTHAVPWQNLTALIEGAVNEPTLMRQAYQDAARRGAWDLTFPLRTVLYTNTATYADYQHLADALVLPWPAIEVRFTCLRARSPLAATSDLLWEAFQDEWQTHATRWTADLPGITLCLEA
jgi:hypothetical protein